jgi:hypothetical protein
MDIVILRIVKTNESSTVSIGEKAYWRTRFFA